MEFIFDLIFDFLVFLILLVIIIFCAYLLSLPFKPAFEKNNLKPSNYSIVVFWFCLATSLFVAYDVFDDPLIANILDFSQNPNPDFTPFYKSDKLVDHEHTLSGSSGYQIYLYLVPPEKPMDAKDYVEKTLAERMDFLDYKGRSLACNLSGNFKELGYILIIYSYNDEEATFLYDRKACEKQSIH